MPSPIAARNLILTCSRGYSTAALAPFVLSWKRQVPDTDLVMFCANTSRTTVDWLAGQGVDAIPAALSLFPTNTGPRRAAVHVGAVQARRLFEAVLRILDRRNEELPPRAREAMLDLSASRYFDYARHLELFGHRYASVLLTDCRDVIFQGSPFPADALCVYSENETVGTSHFARRWLQLTYGSSEWRALARLPFLCSGTTLGPVAEILEYLRVMTKHLGKVMALAGEDQAVHNHVIHRGLVKARIHPFGEGAVITLNRVPLESLRLQDGLLTAQTGRPYPVVHQYDRVPGLAARLKEASVPAEAVGAA